MPRLRFSKLNGELLRNLPPDMQAELIVLEDVIPDGIMASLYVNDSFYKKERSEFLNYRDDVREKMYYARGTREELAHNDPNFNPVLARINLKVDEDIEFIKKYPQFKPLIESIIFEDEDHNVVKEVPIDEYLAEN